MKKRNIDCRRISSMRRLRHRCFLMRRRAFFFLRPFSRGLVRPVITTLTPRAPARVQPRQRSLPASKHILRTRECIQVTANYFLDSNQTPTGTPRQQCRTDQPGTSQDNTFEKCIIIFRDTDRSGNTIWDDKSGPTCPKIPWSGSLVFDKLIIIYTRHP